MFNSWVHVEKSSRITRCLPWGRTAFPGRWCLLWKMLQKQKFERWKSRGLQGTRRLPTCHVQSPTIRGENPEASQTKHGDTPSILSNHLIFDGNPDQYLECRLFMDTLWTPLDGRAVKHTTDVSCGAIDLRSVPCRDEPSTIVVVLDIRKHVHKKCKVTGPSPMINYLA